MQNILTLIDLTSTSEIALKQSIAIAKKHGAKVTLLHIADYYAEDEKAGIKEKLWPYAKQIEEAGLTHSVIITSGNLIQEVKNVVSSLSPNLVVVSTHGKKGIKQNLFGSTIFKMIQEISTHTLVVNDDSKIVEGGFNKILLPIAPHPDYLLKVKAAKELISPTGIMVIFVLIKPGAILDNKLIRNIEATKEYLNQNGVRWSYFSEDSTKYAVGYSKETLELVSQMNIDLISIMARVSEENQSFGKMDKENLLLNKQGMPILCANN
jgi:nucleotide-binding universal stress UspA family protein